MQVNGDHLMMTAPNCLKPSIQTQLYTYLLEAWYY
ncbi:hypothetical protein M8C21_021958 [Ambrosia artemisiifolia]|uniref:Uncharacterized protein n=1 Tax=Ambrosia artemisiifolia TaxID=4212 RepID=A0AAD5CB26_AMBAR|nr:hypothetical protein M8C21_021958 [Ambrosia artemisiifolia]